ncbi:hypothetical protein RO3G_06765 [Lichtheimia corymbifera JMRC:FSU:9682]|uniref:Bar domain-containing protein n=1 Tax=Lichtheimia corymbifera JMRC:FSU:9682 TaxID=1263082 RepID=A0A068S0T3_9FUNG|nr:hypothetical protein RO3G_06765 [Lichtheimia corymbifera JMRC:FSU:9682]
MLKNLGRFKQWTGERLGAAKPTLQTEDIQQLEDQTEQWHDGFERMYQSVKLSYAQLSKRKTSVQDPRLKCRPLEAIGDSWIRHGEEIAENSPKLATSLISLGHAETQISGHMDILTEQLNNNYLRLLRDSRECYKDYLEIRRKLEMRRLDYAANLSRLQKAKKEKPQLEQLLQQSRIKYEETESELLRQMVQLDEYKEQHRVALRNFLDAQLDCYMKAVEMLKDVQSRWPDGAEDDDDEDDERGNQDILQAPPPPMPAIQDTKRISTDSAYERSSTKSANPTMPTNSLLPPSHTDQHNNNTTTTPTTTATQHPKPSSIASSAYTPSIIEGNEPKRPCVSEHSYEPSSEESAASMESHDERERKMSKVSSILANTRRKALYDFNGEHPEDLSFTSGDIITVLEEINQGWWLGELTTTDGQTLKGIFPVNYTEPLDSAVDIPPPPLPIKDASLRQDASMHQHARSLSKLSNEQPH